MKEFVSLIARIKIWPPWNSCWFLLAFFRVQSILQRLAICSLKKAKPLSICSKWWTSLTWKGKAWIAVWDHVCLKTIVDALKISNCIQFLQKKIECNVESSLQPRFKCIVSKTWSLSRKSPGDALLEVENVWKNCLTILRGNDHFRTWKSMILSSGSWYQ